VYQKPQCEARQVAKNAASYLQLQGLLKYQLQGLLCLDHPHGPPAQHV